MLHNVMASSGGTIFSMENELEEIRWVQDRYIECLAGYTNMTKTKIKNQIKKLFLSGAGKHYDKFVLLSKAHRVDWKGLKNIHIISNPIIIDSKGNKANLDSKIVLAVGRHDPIKGFDMLLKSWQMDRYIPEDRLRKMD